MGTLSAEEIVRELGEAAGPGVVLEASIPSGRRGFLRVARDGLKATLRHLVENLGFKHLSTITGLDLGEEVEVIYHLAKEGLVLSLRVRTPAESPVLPTITDIIPGAILYEREVHDLLGVEFEGHPGLSPLILPENWPSGVYPLRKRRTVGSEGETIPKKT